MGLTLQDEHIYCKLPIFHHLLPGGREGGSKIIARVNQQPPTGHHAQWMVCPWGTHFHQIPVPDITMVFCYVLTIHMHLPSDLPTYSNCLHSLT